MPVVPGHQLVGHFPLEPVCMTKGKQNFRSAHGGPSSEDSRTSTFAAEMSPTFGGGGISIAGKAAALL